MKRILWLLTVMILMSGLIYYLYQHKPDPSASFSRTASNFRIENTNTIGRIVLTNKDGSRSDLKRIGDHWTINDQYKARQTTVDFLLTGIQRQELGHIPNKAADEGILKYMAVAGIHVEIFDLEGKPLLSYTVGGVTQDEYGTFFLKDGSTQPYCLNQPGFTGSLRVRYAIPPAGWRDVRFWMEDNDKIDTLSVDYPQQHQHAFRVIRNGGSYDVKPLYSTTPLLHNPSSNLVRSYLTNLSQLACEDFLNDMLEKDSILQMQPFMEMKIVYPGKSTMLRFYPVGLPQKSEFSPAISKYYIDYQGHDFMIGQYEVIKGAFRSYEYFFGK